VGGREIILDKSETITVSTNPVYTSERLLFLKRNILLSILLLITAAPLHAQGSYAASVALDESVVKASILINISKFVQWPASVLPRDHKTFHIGVLGRNPFGVALNELAKINRVQGRNVNIHYFRRTEDVSDCQVLFISATERKRMTAVLKTLWGSGILTVSDSADFAKQGGMVELIIKDDRIQFGINETAFRGDGLKADDRLFQLAYHVIRGSGK